MALKRLRLIQRRKALGYTQEGTGRAARLRAHHSHPLGTGRDRTPAVARGPGSPRPCSSPPEELSELLADVADVPQRREGFTLVTSVPLDFSLSAAYTVRIMEGFSAHDIASRREALADLAVITGAALLQPGPPVGSLARRC